jgi:hypothetical protein
MPRYYFHIRTHQGELIRDEIGVLLPDVEAAREEAHRAAASFSADYKLGGRNYSESYFEVVSEDGREIIASPAFVKRIAAI